MYAARTLFYVYAVDAEIAALRRIGSEGNGSRSIGYSHMPCELSQYEIWALPRESPYLRDFAFPAGNPSARELFGAPTVVSAGRSREHITESAPTVDMFGNYRRDFTRHFIDLRQSDSASEIGVEQVAETIDEARSEFVIGPKTPEHEGIRAGVG